MAMIHKRFDYNRHLVKAGIFLTIFLGSSVTHKLALMGESASITPSFIHKVSVAEHPVLFSTVALK